MASRVTWSLATQEARTFGYAAHWDVLVWYTRGGTGQPRGQAALPTSMSMSLRTYADHVRLEFATSSWRYGIDGVYEGSSLG